MESGTQGVLGPFFLTPLQRPGPRSHRPHAPRAKARRPSWRGRSGGTPARRLHLPAFPPRKPTLLTSPGAAQLLPGAQTASHSLASGCRGSRGTCPVSAPGAQPLHRIPPRDGLSPAPRSLPLPPTSGSRRAGDATSPLSPPGGRSFYRGREELEGRPIRGRGQRAGMAGEASACAGASPAADWPDWGSDWGAQPHPERQGDCSPLLRPPLSPARAPNQSRYEGRRRSPAPVPLGSGFILLLPFSPELTC